MSSARTASQQVDTSTWLTCAQVSDLLGCSENTVRNWIRNNKLHPKKVTRAHGNGVREVDAVDPQEVVAAAAGRRRVASIPGDEGEIAARAFELFDAARPLREIVVALRVSPEKISELHDQWIDLGGGDLVIGRAARAELERFVGEFSDVADLVSRIAERVGKTIEIEIADGSPLSRASDAQIERAIVSVIDRSGDAGEP